jgi:2-oxoisovalerate dehydrogenase E1 component
METQQTAMSGELGAMIAPERLRELYADCLRTRLLLDAKISMKLRGQDEIGGFFIGGMGEEVHGAATAQGLWDALELPIGQPAPDALALFLHYRSDALMDGILRLSGCAEGAVRDQLRQQAARATDPNAGGRQMVMHVCLPEYGIQANQSALGMQLGKAAGYAMGWKLKGQVPGPVTVAVLGNGTTSCSDFHESVSAANLWDLPVLFLVTDNEIAISVPKKEGEAIQDLGSYAGAFDMAYASSGGSDFASIYRAVHHATRQVTETGQPFLLHCPVIRFRGHSSSGLQDFDPEAVDPLVEFARRLVEEGVLAPADALKPLSPWPDNKTRYLSNYQENALAKGMTAEIRQIRDEVLAEPQPSPESIWDHSQAPFPEVVEPESSWGGERTDVTLAQAIRAALDQTLSEGNAAVWGQDVGETLGGVFGCTRFLAERHPGRVLNAPINEPLIVGVATGAAMHDDLVLFPEIQFADYSLNVLHWLVHLGHLHWATLGRVSPNVTLRTASEPTLTGALYHSMSVESYFAHVPAIVVVMPSNAFDAYGLLRTAAKYPGPVVFLEPKDLYRVRNDPRGGERLLMAGPKLPGERVVEGEDGIPSIDDYAIPFGKARRIRSGEDCTVVSHGLALHKSIAAAAELSKEGIEVDLHDLRTLVPYDRDAVIASVQRTGRLVFATEDRPDMSYANHVLRDVHEAVPDAVCRVVGMKEVPATGMAPALYHATVLTPEEICEAVHGALSAREPTVPGVSILDNEMAWLSHAPGWRRR